MGLDITAYSKLTKLDCVYDADGEPIDPATRKPLDWHDYTRVYINPDFPGRADEFEHKACYAYDESHGFRAGSYGGYNDWRERLATLAEYPAVEYERVPGYEPSKQLRRDAAAWQGLCEGMPFVELVNFSDCEGTIGTAVSKKLAQDFAEWDERAKAIDDTRFYERYCEWRKAFELAADSGAVHFH
jgi:hypothetical protein